MTWTINLNLWLQIYECVFFFFFDCKMPPLHWFTKTEINQFYRIFNTIIIKEIKPISIWKPENFTVLETSHKWLTTRKCREKKTDLNIKTLNNKKNIFKILITTIITTSKIPVNPTIFYNETNQSHNKTILKVNTSINPFTAGVVWNSC